MPLFLRILTEKIHWWHYFGDSTSSSRSNSIQGQQKVNSEVNNVKLLFLPIHSEISVVRRFDVVLLNK